MSMLEGKKNIAVFDFDGTITNKDTLLYFILFTKGYWAFMVGFLLYSPLLIAFKLRLYPNWKVKQALFSYFLVAWIIRNSNDGEKFLLMKWKK